MITKVYDQIGVFRFADPELAECSWPKRVRWYTGSTLYKTLSGKYWVYDRSWDSIPYDTRFLGDKEAAQWLLERGYEVPEDLEYQLKGLIEL